MVSLIATSNTPRSSRRPATSATRAGGTRPFERTAEAGREVAADAHALAERGVADRLVGGERLVDGLVDVLLAEGLGRGGEDGDLGDAGGLGAVEAGQVRHQRRVADAGAAGDAGEDLAGVGHLRHPLRRDERRDLDHRVPGGGQPIDEGNLRRGRHDAGLVLQAVPRPHLDDGDAGGQRHRLLQIHERHARLHQLALRAVHGLHHAGARGAHRQLHLHGFEHQHGVAFGDRLPRRRPAASPRSPASAPSSRRLAPSSCASLATGRSRRRTPRPDR